MASGMRFLLHSQSLFGTGHFVRTFEIARALAPGHQVFLVDGGRFVPRPDPVHPFHVIRLPVVVRQDGLIVPVDPTQVPEAVMAQRRQILLEAIDRVRPDVIVIEHFPFSKWELHEEVIPAIECTRKRNPRAKAICSVRDIPPQSARLFFKIPPPIRHDTQSPLYRSRILQTLHTYFDGLMVHADPQFVRLEEHVPWAGQIAVPVTYTGYVSQKVQGDMLPPRGPGRVVVSTGGAGGLPLVHASIAAWRRLREEGMTGGRTLYVFLPPFGPADALRGLVTAGDEDIRLVPFAPDFLSWMASADLSISQAGYNTCTNVLETRVRAILVPNTELSDQVPRARRLAERGLARVLDFEDLDAARLAEAIVDTLACPPPVHDLDLDGAVRTRQILEALGTTLVSVSA